MSKPIRIILADDDEQYIDVLARFFNRQDDMEVITVAHDGEEAITAAATRLADMIILDVDMPCTDGPRAAKTIKRINPKLKILMLTAFRHPDTLEHCLRLGVSGFLTKDTMPQQLVEQVRLVMTGQTVLGPSPARMVIAAYLASQHSREEFAEFVEVVENLSPRLRNVFDDVVLAYTNKEISQRQGLSEITVRGYVTELLTMTQMRSRAKMILTAAKAGFVHDGNSTP
ncbi:response regulator [Arcanobacterium canis]